MKKLLFVFMLLPVMAWSQDSSVIPLSRYCDINIFSEWDKYLNDCNELVSDTTDQYGIVKVNLIPVKVNGKIMSYAIEPQDTTWDKYECDDYKFIPTDRLIFNNTSVFTSNGSGYITTGGSITGSVLYSNDKLYTTESKAVQEYRIERKVICKIKKRKASFEDFFTRWCVERKLISFN